MHCEMSAFCVALLQHRSDSATAWKGGEKLSSFLHGTWGARFLRFFQSSRLQSRALLFFGELTRRKKLWRSQDCCYAGLCYLLMWCVMLARVNTQSKFNIPVTACSGWRLKRRRSCETWGRVDEICQPRLNHFGREWQMQECTANQLWRTGKHLKQCAWEIRWEECKW